MKRNLCYIIFIFITLSLLLILWCLYSNKIYYKNTINQFSYKYSQLYYENEKIKYFFVYQNQLLAKSVLNKIFNKIKKIKKSDYLIIACFCNNNCGICMKRLITDLYDFKNKTGFTQIFLVGDIQKNKFYSMMEVNKVDFDYIFIPELFESNIEYKEFPLLFVINSKGDVLSLFIPELLKDYNETYFDKILTNLVLK